MKDSEGVKSYVERLHAVGTVAIVGKIRVKPLLHSQRPFARFRCKSV